MFCLCSLVFVRCFRYRRW